MTNQVTKVTDTISAVATSVSGSKWNSRKLIATIGVIVPMLIEVFNSSDAKVQAVLGVAIAVVGTVYLVAQAIIDNTGKKSEASALALEATAALKTALEEANAKLAAKS